MKLSGAQFLSKMLISRPADLPGILARRAGERFRTPPAGVATTNFGEVRYPVDMSLHAMARKYYFRTHEMYLERLFRDHLKEGDIFFDIGANMGYWSAFSARLIGRTGEIHAFEPVPRFYASLEALAKANPGYTIYPNLKALGAEPGVLPMAVVEPTAENYENFWTNIGSSSLLPGFLDHAAGLTKTIDVEVTTFDRYVAEKNIDLDRTGFIKIDVEGFESYCLDGMTSLLSKPGRKIPVLCEVLTDPSRNPLLNGKATVQRFQDNGYACLDALTLKPIDVDALEFEENILCVDARSPKLS